MKKPAIRLLGLAMLGLSLVGCGRIFGWKDSGIAQAINTDNLLTAAGKTHGLTVRSVSSGEERAGKQAEIERDFRAAISSGKPGELMAAYRDAVKKPLCALIDF